MQSTTWSHKNVNYLVTGGAGFIGTNIVQEDASEIITRHLLEILAELWNRI